MHNYNYSDINSPSFGWYYPMHSKILKNAAKNTTISEKAHAILLKSVQRPDLEEFFLFGQKHFYYPNDKIKSYLDYTGTHNARHLYKTHMRRALKAFRNGDFEIGAEQAGRALHYLQDMTQPNHIDSGSIIKKAKEAIVPHHKFEMDTYDKQNEFYDKYTPIEIMANSFNDLFNKTVNLSQKNQIPRRNNIENWNNITQNGVDLAISSTRKFLEMLISYGLLF